MISIRTRLLAWHMLALVMTAGVVMFLTSKLIWEGFNSVRDLGLEQIAETVLRHDETLGPTPPGVKPRQSADSSMLEKRWFPDEEYLAYFVSQIWGPNGKLVYSSLPEVGPPQQSAGHHIISWNGQSWRVYTVPKDELTVQVAVTTHIRRQQFYELLLWLALPSALLVLGLGTLVYLVVIRALKPIDAIGQEIARQNPADLERFPTEALPSEIVPLGQALNQLLDRMDALLVNQKRLLADAAHELNTPLAAIRLQGQLVRRASEAEREAALEELDKGIQRAGRVVSQLLLLARLEPEVARSSFTEVSLDQMVRQVVIDFSAQAAEQGLDLGLVSCDPVMAWGDEHALRTLLDNVVDNAIRYAGSGTRIDVALRRQGDTAVLDVSDDGPGIPEADRERVLERFVRLKTGRPDGSGLGLSIVAHTVRLHNGSLRLLGSSSGGLTVHVELPLRRAHPVSEG
ncbi:MAG: sensor histidine kinase [Hydrogenophaga sp.]|jgi:two-component system OmpR family sensor kinase|nr:sensor histidine kinase [Hydrogenophaga sp.]